MLPLVLALTLIPPVPGDVVRPFDYDPTRPFAAGSHRGIDVRTRPGEPVRSPCSGRVTFAGSLPDGGAVALECGRDRVTLTPLSPKVERGDRVAAGGRIGQARGALHLGLRRTTDRWGYRDPQPILAEAPPPSGPAPVVDRRPPSARPPAPATAPRAVPEPWPVYLGMAALALGVVRRRTRTRARASLPRPWPSTSPRRSTT